jgi:hypothetical protein
MTSKAKQAGAILKQMSDPLLSATQFDELLRRYNKLTDSR